MWDKIGWNTEFDAWKPDTTEIVHAVRQEFLL